VDICTIVAKNYVAFARVLARTFREHNPQARCWTLVIDDVEGYLDADAEPFELLTTAELGIDNFAHMAARYDVLELSTAVKPWLLRHLLHERGLDRVAYLDPDIQVFAGLGGIGRLLDDHEMVLIPHLTDPIPDDGLKPSESDIVVAGVYNLGFVALARRAEIDSLLDWWSDHLRSDCLVAPERGVFVDQRWMDLAPGFLDRLALLRDPGYNVAYWNLHARALARNGPEVTVNGSELRFLHFSGFDPLKPNLLSKHQNRIDLAHEPLLAELCREYADLLLKEGYNATHAWPYSYASLPGGLPLDRVVRAAFRAAESENAARESVFTPRGEQRFLNWLRAPADRGGSAGLSNYFATLREAYPGLAEAFPAVDANGASQLLAWAQAHGRFEVPIPDALLPGAEGGGSEALAGVNVAGYFDAVLGVGEAARQIVGAVESQNLQVAAVPLVVGDSPRDATLALAAAEPRFSVNLICANADMVPTVAQQLGRDFFAERYSIGYWWWEVNRFPERWYGSFSYLDEVWAGSRHVADTLAEVSPVPVVRIPPPVDVPDPPHMSRAELGLPEGFLALFVFDYNSVFERKNPLAAIEAYTKAFSAADGASLVIKCINHERDPANHARLLAAAADRPDVHVVDRTVSRSHKDAMSAACDCFVSLHRSEGFGFGLAEAMWLGRPVVATGYSGNLDYMNGANSYLVDYRLVPIGADAGPYPPEATWADPDVDHAAKLLRALRTDPSAATARAERGRDEIRQAHSREAVGRAVAERLARVNARGRAAAAGVPTLLSGDLARASERIRRGPTELARSRFGRPQQALRRLVLRLIKPFTVHQRIIDEELVRSVAALGEGLTAAHRRVDALAGDPARIDDLSQQVDELRADTGRAVRFFDSFGVAGGGMPDEQIVASGPLPSAPVTPWTEEYVEAHRVYVSRALDDAQLLARFRKRTQLPPDYGFGFDERVVEYPWVFTRELRGRVLDAGSTLNHPHTLVRVRPRVEELHIVTLAPEQEAYPFLDVSYLFADLRALPFADETYDTVVSLSTLEHVGMDNSHYGGGAQRSGDPDAELLSAIRELHRVLKPGGKLLLSVPYGAAEDFDWMRVFSVEGLGALVDAFDPETATSTFFRYSASGWQLSSAEDAQRERYRDHFSSNGPAADRAVAARAVACVELAKRR
jgi:glycosyltransferase involved in cell wall biosynthesis/SAM-dependent methyltransferase